MADTINTMRPILCALFVIAILVLLIIFIVRLILNKNVLWIGVSVAICVVGVFSTILVGAIVDYMSMTPEEREAYDQKLKEDAERKEELRLALESAKVAKESQKAESERLAEESRLLSEKDSTRHEEKDPDSVVTTEKEVPIQPPETSTNTDSKEPDMVDQFMELGFTKNEAVTMEEIFTTVGITELSNIQLGLGEGIDKLQSFKCNIFDYKSSLSLHFTIDKRQLCFISLDGIPIDKVDYAYINIFGNVKFKTHQSKKSVTLYDVWDENGEVIPDAIGYKAVFDYDKKEIKSYN